MKWHLGHTLAFTRHVESFRGRLQCVDLHALQKVPPEAGKLINSFSNLVPVLLDSGTERTMILKYFHRYQVELEHSGVDFHEILRMLVK